MRFHALGTEFRVHFLTLLSALLAVALGQSVFSLPLAVPYYYISRAFHRRRALR